MCVLLVFFLPGGSFFFFLELHRLGTVFKIKQIITLCHELEFREKLQISFCQILIACHVNRIK